MQICDFYANREIFITGATGFLGKALIEKLLRDIPKIKAIYIMLRGKKSLSVEERLEQLKKDKVFDRLHQECPQVLNKLHAIHGDGLEVGLGIKPSDLDLLKNVSIIFHMAANVKFDDPLRSSILLNVRGTYELVKIAEKLKNLVVFMHCSTGYCNPFNKIIEEKVYKMPVDWLKTIKIAETYDEYTINALYPKYTGFYPNTYTFTKNLSEQIIQEYSSKLPMVIFRPTVVLSSYKEPVPGWIDNMNGPLAGMIGVGVGILPMLYSKDITLDCVPVDMVTNLTIVAAYKRAMQFSRKVIPTNGLDVINCASNNIFHLDMATAAKLFIKSAARNPMENCIWRYDTLTMTSCYYYFLMNIIIANIPLALILDGILRSLGRKPLMMKITRRIIYTTKAVCFFCLREYNLANDNMFDLMNWIPENEVNTFRTALHDKERDLVKYFDNVVMGVKYNLLNESPIANEATRKRYQILYYVNETFKFILLATVFICLWLIIS